ncbi:MAG TPA: hypothetical protein VKB52_05605 [Rhodanobacteraceae bacterium]|nr:hypothetical protein [Rhodanobacteraceae bacterium]
MMYRTLKPAIIAAALAVALPAAAQTGYRYETLDGSDVRYDYARVVKVDAVVSHASAPVSRETCWQEPTTYRYRPSYTYHTDNDDDDGPDSVTVAGGYDKISNGGERCRTETNWRDTDRVMGYEVTYRYGGREYTTRMDHDPGDRMRIRVTNDFTVEPQE